MTSSAVVELLLRGDHFDSYEVSSITQEVIVHRRFLYLEPGTADNPLGTLILAMPNSRSKLQAMPLKGIRDVFMGKQAAAFQVPQAQSVSKNRCMSLVHKQGVSLHIVAPDALTRSKWVDAIKAAFAGAEKHSTRVKLRHARTIEDARAHRLEYVLVDLMCVRMVTLQPVPFDASVTSLTLLFEGHQLEVFLPSQTRLPELFDRVLKKYALNDAHVTWIDLAHVACVVPNEGDSSYEVHWNSPTIKSSTIRLSEQSFAQLRYDFTHTADR